MPFKALLRRPTPIGVDAESGTPTYPFFFLFSFKDTCQVMRVRDFAGIASRLADRLRVESWLTGTEIVTCSELNVSVNRVKD